MGQPTCIGASKVTTNWGCPGHCQRDFVRESVTGRTNDFPSHLWHCFKKGMHSGFVPMGKTRNTARYGMIAEAEVAIDRNLKLFSQFNRKRRLRRSRSKAV